MTHEGLQPAPEYGFWSGNDIATSADVVIGAGRESTVPVMVSLDHNIPRGNLRTRPDVTRGLSVATRSRFAQLGLEVSQTASGRIAASIEDRGEDLYKDFESQVHVANHGGRPVEIAKGTELFRLYRPGERLSGAELAERMSDYELVIFGAKGRDWDYVYKNKYTRRPGDITGVAVRIQEGERVYIPSNPKPISARELEESEDYRERLAVFYQQAPANPMPHIWFGTLPEIRIPKDLVAEIDEQVAPSLSASEEVEDLLGKKSFPYGRHIGARLLDGGSSWHIKVEIENPNSNGLIPSFVIIRVMHADQRSSTDFSRIPAHS